MRPSLIWLTVGLLMLCGCGGEAGNAPMAKQQARAPDQHEPQDQAQHPAVPVASAAPVLEFADKKAEHGPRAGEVAVLAGQIGQPAHIANKIQQAAPPGRAAPANVKRLIIYTGRVEVIVEDFDDSEKKLRELIELQNGYLAKTEVSGTPGTPRVGHWTVRVPAAKFEEFLTALRKFGELRTSNTDSQDVTDSYHDTLAVVKNLEAQEESLRKLYERKGETKDILEVTRELNDVRTRIDQARGRLQLWDNQVAYSTIQVTLQDRRGYVPPIVPDFGTSIGRTFQASVEALFAFFRAIVLVVVALVPWLIVLTFVGVPMWLLIRRHLTQPVNPRRER
jgi:Domain of unknown function (DUF4349)